MESFDFHTFGSIVYAHVPCEKRRKLDARAEKKIFVGYDPHAKGYRLFNPERNKIELSRTVKFLDETKPSSCLKNISRKNVEAPIQVDPQFVNFSNNQNENNDGRNEVIDSDYGSNASDNNDHLSQNSVGIENQADFNEEIEFNGSHGEEENHVNDLPSQNSVGITSQADFDDDNDLNRSDVEEENALSEEEDVTLVEEEIIENLEDSIVEENHTLESTPRRSTRIRKPTDLATTRTNFMVKEKTYDKFFEPRTLKQALECPDNKFWQIAMAENI